MTPSRRGFAILGVLAGLGAAGVLAALLAPTPPRVALVGDSLAVGLSGPMAKIAAAAGVPFRAQAAGGTTPAQWAARKGCGACGHWLETWSPTVILVVLGTNDIGYGAQVPPQPYRDLVARWGSIATVVWVDPPMMPGDRLAAVRAVIASLGVPVIPAMSGLSFQPDNIHPSDYAPWARFVWERLP